MPTMGSPRGSLPTSRTPSTRRPLIGSTPTSAECQALCEHSVSIRVMDSRLQRAIRIQKMVRPSVCARQESNLPRCRPEFSAAALRRGLSYSPGTPECRASSTTFTSVQAELDWVLRPTTCFHDSRPDRSTIGTALESPLRLAVAQKGAEGHEDTRLSRTRPEIVGHGVGHSIGGRTRLSGRVAFTYTPLATGRLGCARTSCARRI